ncbi:DUF4274 domain-containing protein [Priestia megaterium]|uniref:DUF4274 domain-containing protein n=1 Tax=Priestia megaterium TaxID=1404 RepID=UPI00406BBCB5
MKDQDIMLLKELLYNADKDDVVSKLKKIDDPLILHCFAANYNWNNGFDIPRAIMENVNCDLGTALLMFHYSDGYRLLENPEEVSNSPLQEWKGFLLELYNKINSLEFESQDISFSPDLTRIQIFKLKKNNESVPEVLISKSPGNTIDIPNI